MTGRTQSGDDKQKAGRGAPSRAVATPFEDWAPWQPEEAIQLELCHALEQIFVRTRSSVYEVIVLCGEAGEVLVRGGRFFPGFQRARIVGSTAGGSAVKPRSICVGLHMELNGGGELVITSTIQAVSSRRLRTSSFPALDSDSQDMHPISAR